MFTFVRTGCEPKMYLEDYAIYYADTNDAFTIIDYYDEEVGYENVLIPVISIDRQGYVVNLYDFAYDEVPPSDKPKLIKAIMQLVELKDELDIVNYIVVGDGSSLYYKLYNTPYIK